MCFGICFAFNLQWMDRVVNSDDVKDINLNDPQFKFTLMERRMKEIKGLLSKSGRFTELNIFKSLIVKPYNIIGLHRCRCSKNVL